MSVNAMQITDIYSLMNTIHSQTTGRASVTATTTDEFVSQATTTLGIGTDVAYSVLMDQIMRPIFAVRDYTEKFKGLYRTNEQFGKRVPSCKVISQRGSLLFPVPKSASSATGTKSPFLPCSISRSAVLCSVF